MENKYAEFFILENQLLLKDGQLKALYKDIKGLKNNIHNNTGSTIYFEKALLHKDKELLLMDKKMYHLRMQLEELYKTIAPQE